MEDKIKVISLKKTCASCPSQWDGLTDDNRQVYYRFRWGWLTVTIGKPNDMEQYAAVGGEVIFESDLSHGLDGELSTGDMITITKKKINYQIPESDIEAIRKYEADDYELQQENTEWIAKAMGLA